MKNMYIGIDLGTSSVKLLLVTADGKIINSVTQTYKVHYPRDGWSEQNPEDWYSGVIGGIMRLLVGHDKSAVKGVGVGGQMHGLVVLDKNDTVIRPCILWNDGRTEKQTEYLNEVIGRKVLSVRTANIAFAGFTAPKILWLRENEPENFKRIDKIMLPKDYIVTALPENSQPITRTQAALFFSTSKTNVGARICFRYAELKKLSCPVFTNRTTP